MQKIFEIKVANGANAKLNKFVNACRKTNDDKKYLYLNHS